MHGLTCSAFLAAKRETVLGWEMPFFETCSLLEHLVQVEERTSSWRTSVRPPHSAHSGTQKKREMKGESSVHVVYPRHSGTQKKNAKDSRLGFPCFAWWTSQLKSLQMWGTPSTDAESVQGGQISLQLRTTSISAVRFRSSNTNWHNLSSKWL